MTPIAFLLAALLASGATDAVDSPLAAPASVETAKPAATSAKAKAVDDGMRCRMEKPLGSNRAKQVCTTAAQREAARDAVQSQLGSARGER